MAQQEQDIIQRSEWGARHEDGFGPRPVGDLKVYVHHSVTAAPDLLPPFKDDYAAVRKLESIGEARFGRGISYHFPITPAGLIFEGVSIDRIGAAISNYNTPTANIALVGNYDVKKPPRPMLEAVDWLLHHGAGKWWRKPVITGGHRDAPGAATACPGQFAYSLLDDINRGEYHADGPVFVDRPVIPTKNNTVPKTVKEDGFWGSATTRKMQGLLGTKVDGIVSSQSRVWNRPNPGLTTGWQWLDASYARGSQMITAHQQLMKRHGHYGGKIDGLAGPKYFRGLQQDLGVSVVDGEIWHPSTTVRVLQDRLNKGKI